MSCSQSRLPRNWLTRPLLADLDAFEFTVEAFRKTGGKGLNVTLPFKGQAWEYATDRAERADRVKAVNVLRFDAGGQVHGDSTDGLGLLRDLAGNGLEPKGRRVLLLGAGGAARSVLGDLMDAAPALHHHCEPFPNAGPGLGRAVSGGGRGACCPGFR